MSYYNNWKNFNNPRLTPSVYPVWTYGNDSWSWVPGSNRKVPVGSDQLEYYWKWLQTQRQVPAEYNSVLYKGGMNYDTARLLSSNQFQYRNVPDLRSEMGDMQKEIMDYYDALKKYNLTPQDLRRDKI